MHGARLVAHPTRRHPAANLSWEKRLLPLRDGSIAPLTQGDVGTQRQEPVAVHEAHDMRAVGASTQRVRACAKLATECAIENVARLRRAIVEEVIVPIDDVFGSS